MIRHRDIVLILTILLAVPVVSGTAQTPVAGPAPGHEPPGIRALVWRAYGPAGTLVGSVEISEAATPIPADQLDQVRLSTVTVIVHEFDTTENAAGAFDQISAETNNALATAFLVRAQELTTDDLPGVGSRAMITRLDHASDDDRMWVEYVTVQRDRYVLFVAVFAVPVVPTPGSEPARPSIPTVQLATAIAADGPSPDAPIFMENGTSTGGLWGFMPASDDPLLDGLIPIADAIVYPAPTE